MQPHELATPYALGILGEDEQRVFERHLEDCQQCRDELPSLADAAATLALATEPAPPPPGLRARILAEAHRGGAIVPLRRRALPGVAAAAAIAACAALGLGIWAASLQGTLSRERDERAAQRAALAVLADPGARRVSLSGRAGVLAVRSDGTAALAVRELVGAPEGKTYEAWIISGRSPRPAGLFRGGSPGATLVALERRVPRGATVAVTVEREAGAERPTTRPIFSGRA